MNEPLRLSRPPIVEAVLDIDCDLPPGLNLRALAEPAREVFADRYPEVRTHLIQEHQIEQQGDSPPVLSAQRAVHALQFLQDDEKQLVQVRALGYSFNRLAPYSSLDDYLPEIERTWKLFVSIASPIQIRLIRLRCINRILLPLNDGRVDIDEYLRVSPKLPPEARLTFAGFFNQYGAIEEETGNVASVTMASQAPESGHLPLIFDIQASHSDRLEVTDWPAVSSRIETLRNLNYRVFRYTLTEECLTLFRLP